MHSHTRARNTCHGRRTRRDPWSAPSYGIIRGFLHGRFERARARARDGKLPFRRSRFKELTRLVDRPPVSPGIITLRHRRKEEETRVHAHNRNFFSFTRPIANGTKRLLGFVF